MAGKTPLSMVPTDTIRQLFSFTLRYITIEPSFASRTPIPLEHAILPLTNE